MLEGLKVKSSYPYKYVKVIVLGVFVAAMVKLQQFDVISDPDKVHHRCRAAIQQLTAPVVKLACLNWCCPLLLCIDGEFYLGR